MPFSYFSLSLSAAFVFLFTFYFAPHYPVAGQSIRGGGGGHPDPEIRGRAVSKQTQFGLKIRGHRPPGSATAIGTPAKAMVS